MFRWQKSKDDKIQRNIQNKINYLHQINFKFNMLPDGKMIDNIDKNQLSGVLLHLINNSGLMSIFATILI